MVIAALVAITNVATDGARAWGQQEVRPLDPAAWGSDHVGRPLPEYITGDECLFCHRNIGPTWLTNRHQLSLRPVTPDDAVVEQLTRLSDASKLLLEARYVIGSKRAARLLKKSRAYGKLDLSSVTFQSAGLRGDPDPGWRIRAPDASSPASANHPAADHHWEPKTFQQRCAGCHTTAVDARNGAFSALSIDCFACHGNVPIQHNEDVKLALLSSVNQTARDIASICGQCHLRGGKSKTTGLSFANQFVPGDNLFRDFEVDFDIATMEAMPWGDRHIYQTVHEIVVRGRSTVTCLNCHQVHGQGSEKHQSLSDADICLSCHLPDTDNTALRDEVKGPLRLRTHSIVCDY